MHPEAYGFAKHEVGMRGPFRHVLEIGSRDVNGSPRDLFIGAGYVGLDWAPGPGVDIVDDAATWRRPDGMPPFDCVVCMEVLEHAERWREIVETARVALGTGTGGVLIVTAATDPRRPHSAVDGEERLLDGEWYGNIDPDDLRAVLAGWFADCWVGTHPRGDVYAVATT